MKLLNWISFGATGVVLAIVLGGCGGGGGGGVFNSRAALPLSVSATLPDGLVATIAEPSTTLADGSSPSYTVTLKNNTLKAVTYTATTDLDDVSLTFVDATGTVLRDTAGVGPVGPVSPPTSPSETIAAGQSLSVSLTPELSPYVLRTPSGTNNAIYATASFPSIGGSLPPLEVVVQ